MYYGYTLQTRWGSVPAYSNELNLPPTMPPKMIVALHEPSQGLRTSGRAILVHPVSGSPTIMMADGQTVYKEELQAMEGQVVGTTRTGTPVIMGSVVDRRQLRNLGKARPVAINIPGHSPGIIMAIIVLLIAIVIFYTVQSITWAQVEVAKAEAHKYDVIAESQLVTQEWYEDLNGDGINDIGYQRLGNGELIQWAMSDYGFSLMGTTAETLEPGIDWNDALKKLEEEKAEESMWATIKTIAIVGVAGGCLFLVLRYGLPMLTQQRYPQQYAPAPPPAQAYQLQPESATRATA